MMFSMKRRLSKMSDKTKAKLFRFSYQNCMKLTLISNYHDLDEELNQLVGLTNRGRTLADVPWMNMFFHTIHLGNFVSVCLTSSCLSGQLLLSKTC